MSILSFEFLVFGALLLLSYYTLPVKWRPWVLLAFSIAFVAFSGWASLVHLAVVTLITWGGARGLRALCKGKAAMEEAARRLSRSGPVDWADEGDWQACLRAEQTLKKSARGYDTVRKWLLALLLALVLGSMAFIKYYPEAAQWLNSGWLKAAPLPIWNMAAPLGLSYISFMSAGYLIDVARDKAEAPKNPLRTLLFIGFFPHLPQGPISSWKDLEISLFTGHPMDPVRFVSGFQLMIWGYFKKMVIADRLTLVTAEALKLKSSLTGWLALASAILYAVRLYADFSGGMDVVRGLSRMVGVHLPENFRRPFFSASVAEYWRRWHITLGVWFRSYLLYPLAASRFGTGLGRAAGKVLGKKTGRVLPTALATVLVFLLIGVWHGYYVNAVIYGLYFGVILSLSMLLEPLWKWLNRKLRLPRFVMTPFRLLRTWVLLIPPQYFAFTGTPEKAWFMLEKTFGDWSMETFVSRCTHIMSPLEWIILGGALLILLTVDIICEMKKDFCDAVARGPLLIRWPLLMLLIMIVLVFGCYGTGYDAASFLYTQF